MENLQLWMHYFWYCMRQIEFNVGPFTFTFWGVVKIGLLFSVIGLAIGYLFMSALNARK